MPKKEKFIQAEVPLKWFHMFHFLRSSNALHQEPRDNESMEASLKYNG